MGSEDDMGRMPNASGKTDVVGKPDNMDNAFVEDVRSAARLQ